MDETKQLKIDADSKKMKSKNFLASEMPIWKKILKISWPIVILSITNASYLFVDAILSSMLVEQYSAAAVLGIVLPLISFAAALSIITVVGNSLLISRKLGEKNFHEVEQVFGQGILLAVVYGGSIFLVMFFLAPLWIESISNLSSSPLGDEAIRGGIKYARISSLAIIFIMIRDTIARTLRTEGRSLSAAIIPMIAIPINLLFDWIFMGVIGTGLEGAAYATLIAVFLGMTMAIFYGIWLRMKNDTHINFNFANYVPHSENIKEIFVYGIGPFFRRFSQTIFMIVATIYIIQLAPAPGDNGVDYWKEFLTASSRTMAFVVIIGLAFTQGSAIVISYFYGKKDSDSVRTAVKYCGIFILISNIVASVFLIALTNQILLAFNITSNSNEYRNALYLLAGALPFVGITSLYVTFYTATKNVKYNFLASFVGTVLIGVSLLSIFYFLIYLPTGNTNLFFSVYFANGIIQFLILGPVFYRQYQKL